MRKRSRGARASFGLALVLFELTPARVGPQDLASLLARQSGVSERWREHLIASPLNTIHAAAFSFPRPIGTAIPESPVYRLASLDLSVTGALAARAFLDPPPAEGAFPFINRALKGDRLTVAAPEPEPEPAAPMSATEPEPDAAPSASAVGAPAPAPAEPAKDDLPPVGKFVVASAPPLAEGLPESGVLQAPITLAPAAPIAALGGEDPAPVPFVAGALQIDLPDAEPDTATPTLDDDVIPAIRTAQIYFGVEPIGGLFGTLQPWGPGQRPIFEPPDAESDLPAPVALAALADKNDAAKADSGQTIAGKGEVTGIGRHPKSPAERLGLAGQTRVKHERCLANAIYFESRGEAARGQIAVAQVVMNRVFSGYYPDNVCGVVYQNAHRHLACQFTFACDGIPDRVTEPEAWERAKTIARDTLDGKYWLDDVGKATHYHAYWVHPWWVRTMRKLDRIGVHTFYRPRKWGDGADTPIWGDASATMEAAKKL